MANHQNWEGGRASNVKLANLIKGGVNTQALGAALTLDKSSPLINYIDPGGAGRVVTLPAEADSKGLIFLITNTADAAEDLTVKEDSNTTTIVTISQSESAIIFCNGVLWSGGVLKAT